MRTSLIIDSLFAILVISSPVSQNPYNLDSITPKDPVEDLAFKNEPPEDSYTVAPSQQDLIADCGPDATTNVLLDEDVQKRDLHHHHQEHVKRQACRSSYNHSRGGPGPLGSDATAIGNDAESKSKAKPAEDPCQGMEGYEHLTCGGILNST